MAFVQQHSINVSVGAVGHNYSNSYSAESRVSQEVAVADSATDFEVEIEIDVSRLAAYMIVSDQDVTMETNSGSAADETINLLANKPLVWAAGSYYTNLLATDITSLFFTNASGAEATVKIEAIYDVTPEA